MRCGYEYDGVALSSPSPSLSTTLLAVLWLTLVAVVVYSVAMATVS